MLFQDVEIGLSRRERGLHYESQFVVTRKWETCREECLLLVEVGRRINPIVPLRILSLFHHPVEEPVLSLALVLILPVIRHNCRLDILSTVSWNSINPSVPMSRESNTIPHVQEPTDQPNRKKKRGNVQQTVQRQYIVPYQSQPHVKNTTSHLYPVSNLLAKQGP